MFRLTLSQCRYVECYIRLHATNRLSPTEYMETKWKTLLSCCFSRFSPERREFARSNKNSTFFLLFHFFNVVVCGVFEESIFRWCGPRKTVLDEMLVAFACTLSPSIRFNRLRTLNVGCSQEQTHCVCACVRMYSVIFAYIFRLSTWNNFVIMRSKQR